MQTWNIQSAGDGVQQDSPDAAVSLWVADSQSFSLEQRFRWAFKPYSLCLVNTIKLYLKLALKVVDVLFWSIGTSGYLGRKDCFLLG